MIIRIIEDLKEAWRQQMGQYFDLISRNQLFFVFITRHFINYLYIFTVSSYGCF